MMEPSTGYSWFERLPSGWDVAPLRFMARFESGGTPDKGNREFWDGEIPWVSPKDMKVDRIGDSEDHVTDAALAETSLSMVLAGSVLLVVRGMILAHSIPVAVTTAPVTINQDMKALRCSERIEARFLQAVIHGAKPWFLANTGESSHGTKKLETEVIGRFLVPLPPLESQRAIADFLDAETARIDALIAAKENLLAILAEKRRALVTQAVTRGLDPSVTMRDSGIPWLGGIPAHWDEVRLRFLFKRIEQGWSPQAESHEPSEDEWGVLKLSAVSRGRFDESAAKALPPELEPRLDYEVKAGDFLLTRANTPSLVGDVCFVEATRPKLMLCDLIYRLALRPELVDGRYLAHFLGLPLGRSQIEADARGTSGSMVKISQEHIKSWLIPVPPLAEQLEIVEFVSDELNSIAKVESATRSTLRLLRERREAVIAAAVTGQLDVEVA